MIALAPMLDKTRSTVATFAPLEQVSQAMYEISDTILARDCSLPVVIRYGGTGTSSTWSDVDWASVYRSLNRYVPVSETPQDGDTHLSVPDLRRAASLASRQASDGSKTSSQGDLVLGDSDRARRPIGAIGISRSESPELEVQQLGEGSILAHDVLANMATKMDDATLVRLYSIPAYRSRLAELFKSNDFWYQRTVNLTNLDLLHLVTRESGRLG